MDKQSVAPYRDWLSNLSQLKALCMRKQASPDSSRAERSKQRQLPIRCATCPLLGLGYEACRSTLSSTTFDLDCDDGLGSTWLSMSRRPSGLMHCTHPTGSCDLPRVLFRVCSACFLSLLCASRVTASGTGGLQIQIKPRALNTYHCHQVTSYTF